VTLNSLRMLAWLLSRLRHACSGGAPPSKSNCSESKFPTPDASQHQTTQQTTGKRETKRIRERASADAGAKSGAGSPAAARSGRHTPPPATSSSGSGTCGRSPSRPLASKCYLPLLTPQHPGRGHCRSPTDAILPAPRPLCSTGQSRRFAGRTPSSCASPAATGIPGGTPPHRPASPQIDSAGALGIGWSLPPRSRERRGGAPAGLDRIQPVSVALPAPPLLPFLFARWCAVESFSTSGEGAKKSTAHALVPPEGEGLRFWKRGRKWLQPAYRPRAYGWGVLLVLVGRWVAVPIRELERAVY
jgi:hypothetical protein